MATKGKCDRCAIKWTIRVKDQTPLRELECSRCHGPVTAIRSPCPYILMNGEPNLKADRKR